MSTNVRLACLVLALATAACTAERTQILIGLASDLRAPTDLDEVVLTAWRVDSKNRPQAQPFTTQTWTLSATAGVGFELPGSFGLYSPDGNDRRVLVSVAGKRAGVAIVTRDAIFALRRGRTLFVRLTLGARCIGAAACTSADDVCVEGECEPRVLDSDRFPSYRESEPDTRTTQLECARALDPVAYVRSSDGAPMPLSGDGSCPAGTVCQEGVCLVTPPVDMAAASDLAPRN